MKTHIWKTSQGGVFHHTGMELEPKGGNAIEVATLGSCEFMEVAEGQECKKPEKPQTLAFYMYKAPRLGRTATGCNRLAMARH